MAEPSIFIDHRYEDRVGTIIEGPSAVSRLQTTERADAGDLGRIQRAR
ncbi:hypothetical protein [Bradyrhizobium sp. LMG 9283]